MFIVRDALHKRRILRINQWMPKVLQMTEQERQAALAEMTRVFGESPIFYDGDGNEYLKPQVDKLSVATFRATRAALSSPAVPVIGEVIEEDDVEWDLRHVQERPDQANAYALNRIRQELARAYAALQKGETK